MCAALRMVGFVQHPKRTRHVTPCVPFDCHGYTRPAVSFPPPPDNKRAARQDFVAAVAGCAQPSRARRYLLNTPESTSSGSSTPERLQAATWETSTQRLDGTRTPRPTVGRILFSPGQVTYDHRCRETRLPHLAYVQQNKRAFGAHFAAFDGAFSFGASFSFGGRACGVGDSFRWPRHQRSCARARARTQRKGGGGMVEAGENI